VEAGQLAFVGLLLVLHRALGSVTRSLEPRLRPLLGYGLGALAMLWLLGRLPAVWGA